ncbi:MAG TPA: SDR family NAD(P)-dependent oxidoreductase [Pirellulales bacterium]|jgi:short-subunit dehydrogenase|nr:SDR family NAD(P)-dependent oxidoreductase [Pirellulales bacterium]
MSNYWQNKVAIVTGASTGLGFAIAEALAIAGARVVLAARTADTLNAAADALRSKGADVLAVPTDVTHQNDVEALVQGTLEKFGRIDALVNNAGKSMRRWALETTPEDFREQFELNVIAAVRTTRAAASHLIASNGHLVNIASLAGKAPARYMGAYGPSKAALIAYTQQLRLEVGDQGPHVLLVCPGPVERRGPPPPPEPDLSRLPSSAAKPGGGVKTKAVSPEWLASAILDACEHRRSELVVPSAARLVLAAMQLSPRLGDFLIRKLS